MSRPYSMDLRERLVRAVANEGFSRRRAAARFGVAPSTAVNWLKRVADNGSVAPGRIGGRKPKTIAGSHRDWLAQRCQGDDFTLRGLVRELAERGLKVDYRSVWEFVHAEGLSHKKRRWSQPNRSVLTSPAAAGSGSPARA
jgi:putative transposase